MSSRGSAGRAEGGTLGCEGLLLSPLVGEGVAREGPPQSPFPPTGEETGQGQRACLGAQAVPSGGPRVPLKI